MSPVNRSTSRRSFLAGSAALTAAPMFVPSSVFGANAPSNRVTCGVIGCGARGPSHTRTLIRMKQAKVLAVSDVSLSRANALKGEVDKWHSNTDCTAHQDFRELLDRKDIDAVFIATPENWHGVMMAMASKAGKAIYGEKSLTHTVAEGRALIDVVRGNKTIFQSGTQQRSDPKFRKACELALNGYLGKVTEIHVGVPGGKTSAKPGVWPVAEPPADLNWDLWVGPAAAEPYRQDLDRFHWYFVSRYCVGWIASWGVHHMDIALWGQPSIGAGRMTVEGSAEFFDGTADDSYAWDMTLTPVNGPRVRFVDNTKGHGQGVRFIGEDSWVQVNRGKIWASDEALLKIQFKESDTRLQESIHHHADFFNSIASGQDPVAPIEACHRATTATVACDIATRLKRKLTWDWDSQQFIGDAEANALLSRPLRGPWVI
ncbi:Gfo/Idh/MocA family oxidoreductase [Planctomycetales bacterium ZRK34]|nr:Gfo/Idh/MocA family oxidoreductase [Planctomycetales bacterium ZRK34]